MTRWTHYFRATLERPLWLLLFTVVAGSACGTPGMHLPSRYPEAPEAQEPDSESDPEESNDPVGDVKTAEVDSPAPSPIMAVSRTGPPTPDVPASEPALISALDDRVHAWFGLLATADFEAAARMTGGSGGAAAIAYWWEAMAKDRGRLRSLQVLGIGGSGGYYTVDVRCDFEEGPASHVQLMIRETSDVVSWKRTSPGAPPTPEGDAATE